MPGSIAHAVAEIIDSTPLGGAVSDVVFVELVEDVLDEFVSRFEVSAPTA